MAFLRKPTPEELNKEFRLYLVELMGLEFTEVGDDYIKATMPADERTFQAFRILHGGASVVMAETIGSVAANLAVDYEKYFCVGLEINANHIRSARGGTVTGTTRPLHIGKSTQVWEIRIEDEEDRLLCISRLTMAVMRRDNSSAK